MSVLQELKKPEWIIAIGTVILVVLTLALLGVTILLLPDDKLTLVRLYHWPLVAVPVIVVAGMVIAAILNFKAAKAKTFTTSEPTKNVPLPPPDTSLRDWDPKIHLELIDERAHYPGDHPNEMIWFTPVNRGGGDAKIVRLDDFRLPSGHTITCARSNYRIAPSRHGEIHFKIRKPNDDLEATLNLFDVLWREYEALHDPNLHDFRVPLKVSYQDDIRNLFLTSCDLVFDPRAFLNKTSPIVRVENQSFRKVALAAALLEGVTIRPR